MKTYFSERLSENLKRLRLYHDYPQRYLANVAGTSQYAYSKLERGQMRLSEERLCKIAELYEVPSIDLLHKTSDELIQQLIDRKSQMLF